MPDRLRNMLLGSLAHSLTNEQTSFAAETAKQLRTDAEASASEGLKTALNDVATQLEQAQQSGRLGAGDVANLAVAVGNLEREIGAVCP